MQPTLSPKPTDDPCDDVVTVPDAIQIAPSDEELSLLLQQAARHRSAQGSVAQETKADATTGPIDATVRPVSANDERSPQHESPARPMIPVIDEMDRVAPANDDPGSRRRRSRGRRAVRAFVVVLLASGIGVTAAAWKTYGAAATKIVAGLAAQLVAGSRTERPTVAAQPAPPAASADTASASSAQPAAVAQTAAAADATAPAASAVADQTQLLQSMTRDLATLQQQVEQLKAGMNQLQANQQQISRDLTKVSEAKPSETRASEQNVRAKSATTAPPALPRSAAVQTKKPTRPVPPSQGYAAATALSQAQAPYAPPPYYAPPQRYVPPQLAPPPQVAAEPPVEWDSSAPRPPMPLR